MVKKQELVGKYSKRGSTSRADEHFGPDMYWDMFQSAYLIDV